MPSYTGTVDELIKNTGLSWDRLYEKLERYFTGNGLYDDIALGVYWQSKWMEAMKPLRNVAPRSVEFYVNKTLPGKVTIITENDTLKQALDQILKWSNFDALKQTYLREVAKLGDLFWKVMPTDNKVFIEQVPAKYVTEFDENKRGYLTKLRIEVPVVQENGTTKYHIEWYQKDVDIPYFASYESYVQGQPIADMEREMTDYQPLASVGADFVPLVHAKFQDVGTLRGRGCFTHALDKMDEANRQATNLAGMVFKNAEGVWQQKSNVTDKDGRPLAPAPMNDVNGNPVSTLDLSRGSFIRLPSGSELVSTIPAINWGAIREIANDMVEELKQDMPELRYYDAVQGANLSGKALAMILAPALDRAREAGENFTTGLSQALKMAVTMGNFAGVLSVPGSYDAGDFDHTITIPDAFPPNAAEKAALLNQMGIKLDKETAMKFAGYSQEEIDLAKTNDQAATDNKVATASKIIGELNKNKP